MHIRPEVAGSPTSGGTARLHSRSGPYRYHGSDTLPRNFAVSAMCGARSGTSPILIGATSRYVTEELDQGPIIEQDVCRITHRESVEEIILKGRDLERRALARAVRPHLLNRILACGMKTVVFD